MRYLLAALAGFVLGIALAEYERVPFVNEARADEGDHTPQRACERLPISAPTWRYPGSYTITTSPDSVSPNECVTTTGHYSPDRCTQTATRWFEPIGAYPNHGSSLVEIRRMGGN